MSEDDNKPGKVIEFPYHKLGSSSQEMDYLDALDNFDPTKLDDAQLVATLQSCPLYVMGDVFDERWWSRRIAWLMRIGLSSDHPLIDELFPEAKECTLIEFKQPKFELCWFDEDKPRSVIKIKLDIPLKKTELEVSERALNRKGWDNTSKYLICLFEPDSNRLMRDWTVIPMVDLAQAFHDVAEIMSNNPDMSRNFDDCGSWLLLIDEFTTRYLEYYHGNDANNTAMMRYFAKQLGIDKILDKVARQGTGLF
jgi:hypothetical protein